MNIDYLKWWSSNLGQDMELKTYGQSGRPVLVFPAMGGRFFDFEDFGMKDACAELIEAGKYRFITVDSVDHQSWANWGADPADRAKRHEDYDRYVTQEVIPLIREQSRDPSMKPIVTGCSMGGYHSGNFFFKHPDLFDGMISLSGIFQLKMFVGDFINDDVYFNSPLLYLPEQTDPWYVDKYCHSNIVICVGQGDWEEPMIEDAHAMQKVLVEKKIPSWVDFWGQDVNHDWPWWRKQLPYFLGFL
ncbi:MAG: alpha/beta hydrolase-fold protein [Anaerolineaceae bacterium]|nr:alpha/beta hydrolase-fold protein [Anaerolineaceae bacterium]